MRLDKLTTKFQEALADAQSLALGNDNAYIEPVHLLAAMLRQDGGPRALLAEHPSHGIGHVGLSTPVRPHDGADSLIEGHDRGIGERLEAVQLELGQSH